MSIRNILKKINSRNTRLFPTVNTLTKITLLVLITITSAFFIKNILATDNIVKQVQDAQIKSNNAESWQLNAWNTNIVNVLNTITGPIPFKDDGSIDEENFQVSGLLGTSTKMITALYQPQASGVEYIAQIKDDFLGKPSYAQGVAFNTNDRSLQPLLPLWKTLRNIVYALFSIVFVVIGIMIMLRVKISPQAVITIQNALPKLITSLIMVTFSYAIAGLIIDLSYWIQAFVLRLLFSAKGVDGRYNSLFSASWKGLLPVDAMGTGFIYNLKNLSMSNFVTLSSLMNATVPTLSMLALGGLIGQIVLGSLVGGLGSMVAGSGVGAGLNWGGGAVGWVIGVAGGLIFVIILFILIAFWLIKLFFGLLKTYVAIILKIITGPLEIGMGAFPNSKIGFSSWLIDLISKIAVFPVVLIAVVLINYLIDSVFSGFGAFGTNMDIWRPSLLDTGSLGGGSVLGAAIGLAGLAMISKLPDLVPEAIFMLKPSPFGKAIGENLGGVAKGAQKYGTKGYEAGRNKYLDTVDEKQGKNWFEEKFFNYHKRRIKWK